MTTEQEKAIQDKVKKNINDCDHIGYFVGFGFEVYPMAGQFLVISGSNCMMCGKTFVKASAIESPIPPNPTEKKEDKIIS